MYVRKWICITVNGSLRQSRCVTQLEHSLHFHAYVVDKLIHQIHQPILPPSCIDTQSQYQYWTTFYPRLVHDYSSHQKIALLGLYLIPSLLVTKTLEEVTETLKAVEMMYSADLNDSNFVSELHQWYVKWKHKGNTH